MQSIIYSNVFDDFDTVNVDELLKDVPILSAVKFLSDIEAWLYVHENPQDIQYTFYEKLIPLLPEPNKTSLLNRLRTYYYKNGRYACIIDRHFNLQLIDYLLANHDKFIIEGELNDNTKLNLFKAYLYLGEKNIALRENDVTLSDKKSDEENCKMLMPKQIPHTRLFSKSNFNIELKKAIIFFEFCETNEYFKKYLEEFLRYRQVITWKSYLGLILTLYLHLTGKTEKQITFTIDIPEDKKIAKALVNTFTLNIKEHSHSNHFLSVRENPIVKIADNRYVVLNMNFLIEKLFSSIQFDFASVLSTCDAHYKGEKIIDYGDFKARPYAQEFSEKILFYTIMNKFIEYQKPDYYASGAVLKSFLKEGEPDFYCRDNKHVYFFEFKDTFLSDDSRYSKNFNIIFSEISKKLISSKDSKGKISPKGVTQLANSIKYYIDKGYEFDNYYSSRIILPILVLPDEAFASEGFNFILNKEFHNVLKSLGIDKNRYKYRIKSLTVISLDFFIEFHRIFSKNTHKLHDLILNYENFVSTSKSAMSRLQSFERYAHDIGFGLNELNYKSDAETLSLLLKEAAQ